MTLTMLMIIAPIRAEPTCGSITSTGTSVSAGPCRIVNVASPKPADSVAAPARVKLTSQARMEIDLRGLRVDDGLAELERQLDAAYLNGMPFVRVIHGKGTGAMKKAVREALQTNPHVKRFEGGKDEEGGEGVTIAFMVSDL